MARKRIAVISAENEASYQNSVIMGINSQAASCDCEILVFTTLVRSDRGSAYRTGEINIYNLINFDEIDGIIVLYLPLEQDDLLDVVYPMLKEKAKCPIVCIDNMGVQHFFDDEVTIDNFSGMEAITEHVIEKHGCRNICCVTGPENNSGAILRRDGYLSAMNKYGLDTDGKVFYGPFWYENGEAVADKIISGELKRPDAVVCAADSIAVGLANCLVNNGIRVPEDVIVTGYDASDIAVHNLLCITSVRPPLEKLGAQALARLWEIITGEDCTVSCKHSNIAVKIGQSCGCQYDFEYINSFKDSSSFIKQNHNSGFVSSMGLLNDSMMTENLTQSKSSDDCYNRIGGEVYLLRGTYRFFEMYLCEGWDDITLQDEYLRTGYSANVMAVLHNTETGYVEEHPYLRNEKGYCMYDFSKRDLPDGARMNVKALAIDMDGRYDEAFAWYFTPVHFADRCFGYMVLACPFDIPPFDMLYRNWVRNVNNALEMQRIRNKLLYSSARDELTGLYNRKGLVNYLDKNAADADGAKIFYMIADMDGLKYINDNYGHNEGDNGIKIVAQAAVASAGKNEVCIRTGGDEFAVVGFGDYDQNDIEEHIKAFDTYIERYNSTSCKPYKVHASLGFCCETYEHKRSISYYSAIADKQMYKNKTASKSSRRYAENYEA